MDLPQDVQPAAGQPEAAAPPPPPQESQKHFKEMLHRDSQLRACKEKDIVMHRANRRSDHDGVRLRLRLRLTNRMRTSLSIL